MTSPTALTSVQKRRDQASSNKEQRASIGREAEQSPPQPELELVGSELSEYNAPRRLELAKTGVTILLVDDNPDDISIMRRLLGQYRHLQCKFLVAYSLVGGLEMLEQQDADVVMLDYSLPAEDGLSFLRRSRSIHRLPPIIMVTGQNDYRLAAEAIRSGATDCIYKHSMTSHTLGEAVERALNRSHMDRLLSAYDEHVIKALAETANKVDPTTGGQRLAHFAVTLGEGLSLTEHELGVLRYGALLHDIGKLGIRNELIRKPSSLTDAEYMEIQLHPLIGERLCAPLRLAAEVGPIIRHHHERWDGRGYVDGLAGSQIPRLARIISVADAFEAMTADRPYRAALSEYVAVSRLRAGAGSQWDPEVVEIFLEQVAKGLHRTDFGLGAAA